MTVYDKSTGAKLGDLVRTDSAHFAYRNRKGQILLARRDRAEAR